MDTGGPLFDPFDLQRLDGEKGRLVYRNDGLCLGVQPCRDGLAPNHNSVEGLSPTLKEPLFYSLGIRHPGGLRSGKMRI